MSRERASIGWSPKCVSAKVEAVAAREVSRFARNSRDWQHLIEMCCGSIPCLSTRRRSTHCAKAMVRLLLGLKGSLKEYELHLLCQRSLSARYEKARRGELVVAVPVGFVKVGDRLEKNPDRRMQEAITLVFERWRNSAVHGRPCSVREHRLDLPAKRNNGDVVWRRPSYATIHRMIENPIYGGAYAYGKTRAASGYDATAIRSRSRRKARDKWLALIPGAQEGYVSWERAEAIRKMVTDNVPTSPHHRVPKHGDALLAGLVRCGRKLRSATREPSTTFGAIPAGVVCSTMASRVASPCEHWASTTPSRKLFCGLSSRER
ncbi:recombinase family protein [Mesorhizobium sp.]|uniref:recombinase family protein n=1 Tax=Mesorhizobium sp. TaxID=1871066 RepID=UPI0025FD445B|nr:recombinase family protein [Mesorhizobium sp.]